MHGHARAGQGRTPFTLVECIARRPFFDLNYDVESRKGAVRGLTSPTAQIISSRPSRSPSGDPSVGKLGDARPPCDLPIVTTYSDYKDFNGVKFPTKIVQTQGEFPVWELTITSVQPNAPAELWCSRPPFRR